MPDISRTLDLVPGSDFAGASLPVEKGLLLSLSAIPTLYPLVPGQTFIRLGVSAAGLPPLTLHTVFAEGYVFGSQSLHWHGQFLLESGDLVMIIGTSDRLAQIRMTGRTIMQPFPVVTLEP